MARINRVKGELYNNGENQDRNNFVVQQQLKTTLFFFYFFFADSFLQRKKSLLICCPSGYTKSASDITFLLGFLECV